MRLMVDDAPGVLRDIAGCMAAQGISMSHVMQRQQEESGKVPLVLMTHETTERAMQKAKQEIQEKLHPTEMVSFKVLA